MTIKDSYCIVCSKKGIKREILKEAMEVRYWLLLEQREKELKKNMMICPGCKEAIFNPESKQEITCEGCQFKMCTTCEAAFHPVN